jgi:hypothetical protein
VTLAYKQVNCHVLRYAQAAWAVQPFWLTARGAGGFYLYKGPAFEFALTVPGSLAGALDLFEWSPRRFPLRPARVRPPRE